jgi:hypothetical protein
LRNKILPNSFYEARIYSDIKVKQGHYKKRKLKTNVPHEYRWEILKKRLANKIYSMIMDHLPLQVGFIPRMQA